VTAGASWTPTRCAICATEGNADELYPARLGEGALSREVFSARRLPDRLHYRVVRCRSCGLVRSDPIADPAEIARLYEGSRVTYGDEIANLRRTYGRFLSTLDRLGARRGALLDIGCGSGFFLEEALARGYAEVAGVEPSDEAREKAAPSVRRSIEGGMMRPGLFAAGRFDAICLFQVLDHVVDPAGLLDECRRIARPGGLLLCVSHDVGAPSARLMGERSPIVDVEHTFLYSRATVARLLRSRGFEPVSAGAAVNTYSLGYLVRLVPLPGALKRAAVGALDRTPLGRLSLTLPLGNFCVVARAEGTAGGRAPA